MIRIVTQLGRDDVVEALRELAPKDYNPRHYRSTFEGEISRDRVRIGYRWGWFVPPIRLVTFSGQLGESPSGTVIVGSIGSGWIIYVYGAWLFVVPPLSLIHAALARDFSGVLWVLLVTIFLFFLGRAFVRSTQDYVVNEIRRAVRGKLKKY